MQRRSFPLQSIWTRSLKMGQYQTEHFTGLLFAVMVGVVLTVAISVGWRPIIEGLSIVAQ